MMGCPLKELDTSALSASIRRPTEGVLEVEGPTSADAGVASCLLFDTEPVFRRLRDGLLTGYDTARWKRAVKAIRGKSLENCGTFVAQAKQSEQSDSSNGEARVDTIGTKMKTRTFKRKKLLATTTQRIDLNIYIVGAGA